MNEQEQMLTSVMNCRRVDLYVDKKEMTPVQERQYARMLKRRQQGEPLQYIIGHCEFLNTKLFVNEHVLIPRPETELLVEMAVQKLRMTTRRPLRILDLGTGSGNIAIAIAKRIYECHVDAVDISREAIMVARHNAEKNFVQKKTTFIWCDMFNWLGLDEDLIKPYDMIISNPPYIPSADVAGLPADVQREPHIALDGGVDGLAYYRGIIAAAGKFLKPDGYLMLEIGEEQSAALKAVFKQYSDFQKVFVFRDYTDADRFLCAQYVPDTTANN